MRLKRPILIFRNEIPTIRTCIVLRVLPVEKESCPRGSTRRTSGQAFYTLHAFLLTPAVFDAWNGMTPFPRVIPFYAYEQTLPFQMESCLLLPLALSLRRLTGPTTSPAPSYKPFSRLLHADLILYRTAPSPN